VRRRREVTVDCLHNGTLTARGYGVATAWPDKGRLSFAFAAANRTRALVIGVNASDAIEGALAAAGFNAGGAPFGLPGLGPADGAAASVSLSPVKFALPTPEGDTVAKAAFLVEVRATLASGDPDQLEDGYSRALLDKSHTLIVLLLCHCSPRLHSRNFLLRAHSGNLRVFALGCPTSVGFVGGINHYFLLL
jgi:hypothetical protein